ncbi:hypothetical protein HBI23_056460 [Parastagonospora nodorum]|nr:hypothetical protein HBI23_056460 [Parastagonospora nodorum]KAH6060543.1 hypothetical protein HBI66_197470 [Parastagonospora nodorum]KAH6063277.1 hypothetical protein HBI67_138060 [Parastagonospora nodorum]KAH6220559.1 hypothetical protein HBI43_100580 [Parastagonospora nodorum]KAH6260914.1 hypothetical protein HBI42_089150 [Parastagonospora nodorum]
MHVSMLTFLSLGLISTVLGAYSTNSTQVCSTYYGSKSTKSIPRQTKTKKSSITVRRVKTINPVKTVTLKPVTRTSARYVSVTVTNTASRKTDVFTKTAELTTYSIDTVTSTTVTTVFEQTEVTLPYATTTTTISTDADFLPILSDYANYAPEGTAEPTTAYEDTTTTDDYGYETVTDDYGEYTETSYSNPTEIPRIFGRAAPAPARFPTSISCEKRIIAYTTISATSTGRKTSTKTLPARTVSATITGTRTVRIQRNPRPATSTTTFSTTYVAAGIDVRLSTSTTTSTLTRGVPATTETAYPGCGDDNFISQYDGFRILGGFSPEDETNSINVTLSDPPTDQVTCCQRCQTQDNCAGFYSGYGTEWNQDRCILLVATTCQPAEVLFEFHAPRNYGGEGAGEFGYVVGNGGCGRVQYDGGRYDR